MRPLVLLAALSLSGCAFPAPPESHAAGPAGTVRLVLIERGFSVEGPAGATARAFLGGFCANATYDATVGTLTLMQNGDAAPPRTLVLRVATRASFADPRIQTETDPETNDHAADLTFPQPNDDLDVRSALDGGPSYARLRFVAGEPALDPPSPREWSATFDVPSEAGILRVREHVSLSYHPAARVRIVPPEGPCFSKDRCGHVSPEAPARQDLSIHVTPAAGRAVVRLPLPVAPDRPELFVGEHEGAPTARAWLANLMIVGPARAEIETTDRGEVLRVEVDGEATLRSTIAGAWRRATCTDEGYLNAVWSTTQRITEVAVRSDGAARVLLEYEGASSACGLRSRAQLQAGPGWTETAAQAEGTCS